MILESEKQQVFPRGSCNQNNVTKIEVKVINKQRVGDLTEKHVKMSVSPCSIDGQQTQSRLEEVLMMMMMTFKYWEESENDKNDIVPHYRQRLEKTPDKNLFVDNQMFSQDC